MIDVDCTLSLESAQHSSALNGVRATEEAESLMIDVNCTLSLESAQHFSALNGVRQKKRRRV